MSLLSRLERVREKDAAVDPALPPSPTSDEQFLNGADTAPTGATAAGAAPTGAPRVVRASEMLASEMNGRGESNGAEAANGANGTNGGANNSGTAIVPREAVSEAFRSNTGGASGAIKGRHDDAVSAAMRGFETERASAAGILASRGASAAPAPESRPMPPANESALQKTRRDELDAYALPGQGHLRTYFEHKHQMFDAVLGGLDPRLWEKDARDGMKAALERGADRAARDLGIQLDRVERDWLVREFTQEVAEFGPITPFLDDPAIGKIVINGANEVIIERLGVPERTPITFRDEDHLLSLIRRTAEVVGGRIDAKMPLLDRPLPDGSRVRAKVPPLSQFPSLTIEKTNGNPFESLRRQQTEAPRPVAQPYAQLRERIQQRMLRELDGHVLAGNPDALRSQVEEMIAGVIQEERVAMTRAERAALVVDLLNEIIGLGPLETLLNDPEVDEIMVNGPFQVYAEKRGKLQLTNQRFRDNGHVMQVVERILAPLGRRVDEKSPMVDGRLRDGSRFNAIVPPLALSGPTLTIRKFARDPFTMTDLINFGSMSREAAQFLQAAVEARLNIVVSGGTGSGKTTTLNVLSSFIPSSERIVTIEDAAELQLRQEHVVRLETRPANIEGSGEVAIRDLVRNSLRMRPDRIVIGECRGAEALDMLQAMNTGHDGSLTTGHSNGPRDMLKRLETMVMMAGFDLPVKAIREQISMAVHLIVHQDRMRDGGRRVTYITEIVGMEGDTITMQDIFRFEQEAIDHNGSIIGRMQGCGLRPKHMEEIEKAGIKLPPEMFQPVMAQARNYGR